jgi:histidinol phosphatase-like enzyme (inositol monophosphatase family)
MPSSRALSELYAFAVEVAHEAGRSTLAHFQTSFDVETKADATPVTIADRRAEELLRARIERRFPDHAILGEEYGLTGPAGASCRWILDPVDGTRSFVHGVPLYATLVGVEVDGDPAIGVAYFPALDEMIHGARGLGAHWNGRPCRVSSTAALGAATFCYTSVEGFLRSGRRDALERLLGATGAQRGWGDAYAHALVATGRVDLAVEPVMNVWDNAPLLPILAEAGGRFTDWTGAPRIDGGDAVSTNGMLHDAVLSLLRTTTPAS